MREVGPRPPLAAPVRDRPFQLGECLEDAVEVGLPTAPATLDQPVGGGAVTALAIAAAARGQLVLRPRRAALDPRHEMVGGGPGEGVEAVAAPHTGGPVPLDGGEQAEGARVGQDGFPRVGADFQYPSRRRVPATRS